MSASPPPAGASPVPLPPGTVVPAPDLVVAPARRRFVLVLSLLLFVLGTTGSNVGPAWVDERPVTVLLMSSRNRNLLGSVPYIDLLPYAIIGFCRVLLAGVALYFLGKWYGSKAIEWAEGQVGELPAVYGWFQRAIDRAGWLMLVLMPGSNLVCLMAGHRRMRLERFLAFISVGISLKLVVLWWGGKQFEEQIVWFLDAIQGYQWWIVAGLFGVTFLQSARKVRRSLPEIVDEIETPDGVIPPHRPHHPFGADRNEASPAADRSGDRFDPGHGDALPGSD